METVFIAGRILFAALFLSSAFGHLTKTKEMGAYAASMGVPAPQFMTFLTGLMILAGGLSVLFDFDVFLGALLIVLFLIPTAFMMHAFWKVSDPMMKQFQQVQFMKNLSLAGAALMFMYYSGGLH